MFEKRSLESLVERQQGGGTPERHNPRFWNGPIPWASVKDFADNQLILNSTEESITQQGLAASSTNLIPAGTPLICTRMAVGRCAISNSDVTINQDVKALFPKANVSPRYLLRLLDSLKFHAESVSVGSTVKGIRISDLLGIQTPIAPQHEQTKIAQILDTLDTQIQKTEAMIVKLEKIKDGLLHDLLTRGIDQNGQLRPTPEQAPELYKESALGLVPKEWHKGTISDYLLQNGGIKPGPFGSSITKNMYRSSGYKIYGQEQVIRADPTFGNYYIDRNKYSELIDFSVQPRDILISLVGTVGKVLIIPESHEQGIINPRLMRLRPNQNICNSEFLSHVLTSVLFTRKLTALAGGGTMPVINKRIVQSVVLPVIPLTEQNEIRSKISSLLGRLVNEKAMLAKLQAQKIGLMDDLLTGHVRVTTLLKDAV
ncbi:type I restriction enzyme, S subunit [Marinobacter sp. LV10R510-11A]|uniref:restriction endonuclease subunit S n=1 Tax=Marinobacter sp. LV10R510-11A TaxID=1415568 RepID=UPI000BB990EF|nr:restriction endonuclease subunit S [Marinobacter sp. LV10R510-11A]SOB76829.1 type I restriction enzyme, S subunit [Marinobacter sp. LV10R510-11A]